MGLDDADLPDNTGDRGKASVASCSICLEAINDDGERSRAKLFCGHEFHLDCIGSAFNIKGAMQCPNCRKIEIGNWLYSAGSRPVAEINLDDWAPDEDFYNLSFSELSVGVHWCPFSGLARLPPSFNEELSSSTYRNLGGQQHAIFAEHPHLSSAGNPYIAYSGPVHPSSSERSNFNTQWNGPSVPSEIQSFALASMDVQYGNWEQRSSPFPVTGSRIGAADQPSIPVVQREARSNSDIPRSGSFVHPLHGGHRAVNSGTASMAPYPGSEARARDYPGSEARARDRVNALQAYFQQPSNLTAPASSSTQTGSGVYLGPTGYNYQEADNAQSRQFHEWVRQADGDPVWGPPQPRQRHGNQRHGTRPHRNWP